MMRAVLRTSGLVLVAIVTTQCGDSYKRELRSKADEHYEAERYQEAVNNYTKLLESGETSFDLLYRSGRAYVELRNYSAALNLLKQADELKRNRGEVLYLLGVIFAARREFDLALEYLAVAVKEGDAKTRAKAHTEIANIHWKLDRKELAEEHFKKAISEVGGGDFHHYLVYFYNFGKDYDRAISAGQKAVDESFEKRANQAELHYQLATAHEGKGSFKEAREHALKAVRARPDESKYIRAFNAAHRAWEKAQQEAKREAKGT